ncbi:hypothetical protein AB0K16_32630 [Nonomuraea jabiensis]|uniref:hypothetical protein n=1 Tax=Nonomuraea jabiensis TaxID=882448 RepID=UPI00341A4A6E
MTREHGPTPSDEDHEPPLPDNPPQDQPSGPAEQAAATDWTPPPARPWTVTIASALWICLGSVLGLAMISFALGPEQLTLSTGLFTVVVWIGVAVTFIVLAKFMREGSDGARIALTVLGSMFLLGLWPALFVLPAVVLQFRPASNAWFQAVKAGRPRQGR